MSTSAPEILPPPSNNRTLKVESSTFAKGWKSHEAPWRKKPIPIPPPPPMDPVGERIREELQRRRGLPRKVSHVSVLGMPMKMLERIGRNQRRVDGEVRPSRRFNWEMYSLAYGRYNTVDVPNDVIGDKAMSMAKETLYLTQERIRLFDDYVHELQRASGTQALFNIGYTIKKMKGLLEDCYIIYTVLFRPKFKQVIRKHNVGTTIYYYTYCFKKYIDIIYYVEAVMVAYTDVMKDNYRRKDKQ